MTPLARWRLRRDACICALAPTVSQRILADVFDLPQSRISAIVRNPERLLKAIGREASEIPAIVLSRPCQAGREVIRGRRKG